MLFKKGKSFYYSDNFQKSRNKIKIHLQKRGAKYAERVLKNGKIRNEQKSDLLYVMNELNIFGGVAANPLYKAILDVTNDSHVYDRWSAGDYMVRTINQFWAFLQADLQSAEPSKAQRALTSLHHIRGNIAYPEDFAKFLLPFLDDKSPEIMRQAYEILLCCGLGTESYSRILGILNGKNIAGSVAADCFRLIASDKKYAISYIKMMLGSNLLDDQISGALAASYMGEELLAELPLLETALENALSSDSPEYKSYVLRAFANIAHLLSHKEKAFIELWEETSDDEILDILINMGSGFALDVLLKRQFGGKDVLNSLRRFEGGLLTQETVEIIKQITIHACEKKTNMEYVHTEVISAISELSQTEGTTANNLLILTAELQNYSFEYDPYGEGGSLIRVSYDKERNMARQELLKRGNPKYERWEFKR